MTRPYTTGKRKFDEHTRALRLASIVTTRCAHCRRWKITGPLAETKEAYRQHRATDHPELAPPRPRIRLRPGGWQTGVKRIEENIEAARKVGAGRNAA